MDLKYFKKSEFTDFEKMDKYSIECLEKFRELIGLPIFISSSNGGEHVKNSQHYLGKAFDIFIPKYEGKLFDLIEKAKKCGFKGIGLYPHWRYQGRQMGGMHLDTRENDARWIGVMSNSKQILIAFDETNLRKYNLK